MRSTLTLGFIFLALAGFARYAGGPHLGPLAWALMGLLATTGILIILRTRAGFYLGILTGVLTALAGLLAWMGVGGAKLALPLYPGISVVVGLYMCMRVVTTPIEPRASLASRLRDDEPEKNAD